MFEIEPEHQHMPGEDAELREEDVQGAAQTYLSKPMVTEADGMTTLCSPRRHACAT